MKPGFLFPLSAPERRHLLDIARGMLGSQADAEDAVHEAYVRAIVAQAGDVQVPLAWLTTVVKRLAIDSLRRGQRARPHGQAVEMTAPSAEAVAAQLQARALALRRLAEVLQPTAAAMLLLREVFDVSYAALAERTGKSEDTCRQTVHRALLRLREGHHGEAEDRATADALYVLCLRAMQTHSPAPLHGILAAPLTASARQPAPAVAGSPLARSGVVQTAGGYALVLMHEGQIVSCLPLGPMAAARPERVA